MSEFTVNMNEYLPLRDLVFNTLRQAILKGELKPGERLMEIQLAEKLGVSRTPIREAIRKLELEGLVIMIPRRGAEVAKISHKSLQDVLVLVYEGSALSLILYIFKAVSVHLLTKVVYHLYQLIVSGGLVDDVMISFICLGNFHLGSVVLNHLLEMVLGICELL